MHAEVASFAENLIAWIAAQEHAPDLLHAHYADAAAVAAIVEDRLGIPFVFTAHSLGRVKASMLGEGAAGHPDLVRRIATEEAALSRASLVIASSRDEAEVQYAGYAAYDPGRVRVLPPAATSPASPTAGPTRGSTPRSRASCANPASRASGARPPGGAQEPRRPGAGLRREPGPPGAGEPRPRRGHPRAHRRARRRDGRDDARPPGANRPLRPLRRVAYPKTHRPEDVPALYAHARARGGLFVNPALNEPFGLTLLEASAAGLPLVATDSGGPNDIVETCGNGLLVDPRDPGAIAAAALRILDDPAFYARCVAGGARAAAAYDWDRHAARYHALLRALRAPVPPLRAPRQLLICDIDNTLVGCASALGIFRRWRSWQASLAFGVATGRSFHSAMAVLEQQDSPRPQVMITSVGSEIYHLDANGVSYTADAAWREVVSVGWERERLRAVLSDLDGLAPQGPLEQRAFKLSYFGDAAAAARVRARLARAGLRAGVIHSHGRYLDVLPERASKGTAVDHVRALYRLPERALFVAGDSGNDIEMLRARTQAIIVANYSDDLADHAALQHSYVARASHARGIIEGVAHFRRALARPVESHAG